jgi:hypothetical protein
MSSADRQFGHFQDGTRFVIEFCGSEQHGNEFVHSFLEFPDGRIVDFGIAPRLPSVPGEDVSAVPSLHDLVRHLRRRKKMLSVGSVRKGFLS